jgi:glycine oxidase
MPITAADAAHIPLKPFTMPQAYSPAVHGRKQPDVLIIGAGIMGLWAARHAMGEGLDVVVIEKRQVGAGASGGFLGALMPHLPERWDRKIKFQFDALREIDRAVAALESDTGVDCGFRRCGRLMPIVHEQTLALVEHRIAGARKHWSGEFAIEHLTSPFVEPAAAGWLSEAAAPFGAMYDNFSARIDPRSYLYALATYVRAGGEIIEGAAVRELIPHETAVVMADGARMAAGRIVIACGWEAYPLLEPFMMELSEGASEIGCGVKGQAVLLESRHADDRPILYGDGSYVVPQRGDRVAIGSTSIRDWQSGPYAASDFDPDDQGFIDRALKLAPSLRSAPVIERWAAVRPRNTMAGRGTGPYFGPVPGCRNLHALLGGFKIGLGIAHAAHKGFS